ncbi:isochorismatase family protein [Microbispora siamensis]|uniref:N-carbamoylsarcosine amidase n=1 Tax=Microbispora siamensis TaxID=564413 RepID=A0ABQ4GUA8_9ACTN|nr:isochorismatase family protein [Microbispora siamensis]GIH65018.1 N-carbamoylsarcosine amidase [Microbispora siamensis]
MTAVQTHGLGNRDLLDQYLAAGFAGRVGWGERVAVLVIDMAGAWTRPDEMIGANLDGVLDNIRRLLEVVRERDDIPVVFTTMAYDETYSDLPLVTRLKTPHSERMIRGSERVRLVPELDRRPHEALIEKPRASAFFNTNLLSILVAQRIDTVIVVGCSTSGCIRSTCESALDYGFRAIVPAEAVGDRSASAHEANLFDINARYADVLPIDEVIDHLGRRPRTGTAVTTGG